MSPSSISVRPSHRHPRFSTQVHLVGSILLPLMLTACSGSGHRVIRTEEGGVPLVRTTGGPLVQGDPFRMEPEQVFGDPAQGVEGRLMVPGGYVETPDGGLAVFDRATQQVKIYTEDGRYRRSSPNRSGRSSPGGHRTASLVPARGPRSRWSCSTRRGNPCGSWNGTRRSKRWTIRCGPPRSGTSGSSSGTTGRRSGTHWGGQPDTPLAWDVLSADGEWLGTQTMPQVARYHGRDVCYVTEDLDEVSVVVRYRLTPVASLRDR